MNKLACLPLLLGVFLFGSCLTAQEASPPAPLSLRECIDTAMRSQADVIIARNNVVAARTGELLDCKDTIVVTEDDGHLIAAIGMENVVIAHSPDATLVCPVSQTERLKELLDRIERRGATQYL